MLNNYSLPPLISAILFLILGLIVFIKSEGRRSVKLGFLFNSLVTFWWQFSWFFLFNTSSLELAKVLAKIGHIGIALIPATYLHYFTAFVDSKNFWKLTKKAYFVSILFILVLPTNLYIDGVNHFNWGYYPKAGILHPLFLLYLFSAMGVCFYQLLQKGISVQWTGTLGTQLYFLLTSFLVYCLAASDFLVNYGVSFYPIGVIAILVSLGISAYAIVRYHLMDIRLAISNVAIFFCVCVLAIGIPFYLYSIDLKLLSLILAILLSSTGPFIYLYFQKKAGDRILQEEKRILDVLKKTSFGLITIRELGKLLNFVNQVLIKSLNAEFSETYILNQDLGSYILRYSSQDKSVKTIPVEDPLIKMLSEKKYSVATEEIKFISSGEKKKI